jgi:2-C-methyl-D-erythritol 4-phosphate cytidylyltransferase
MVRRETTGVILVGAGQSVRMGGIDKIFAPLGEMPILLHSLIRFQEHPNIDHISLVLSSDSVDRGSELVRENNLHKVCSVTTGGPRRQDSVRIGLSKLSACSLILVHDVARPLIETDLISRGLGAVLVTGVAAPVLPISDTVTSVDSDGNFKNGIVDRKMFRLVQTPQVFKRGILERAHNEILQTVTDDATMSQLIGIKTESFEGSRLNFKITVPEDLIIARALLPFTT